MSAIGAIRPMLQRPLSLLKQTFGLLPLSARLRRSLFAPRLPALDPKQKFAFSSASAALRRKAEVRARRPERRVQEGAGSSSTVALYLI